MKNIEAVRYKNRLDDLFKKIQSISDIELQAHWSRYMCILVSGLLEVTIPNILALYSKTKSSPPVYNFVITKLKLRNPNMEEILQLVSYFSKKSGEVLKSEVQGQIKDSIDSIYGNRNQIAHGNDTGVTYNQIFLWYKDAVRLIEKIENHFEKI